MRPQIADADAMESKLEPYLGDASAVNVGKLDRAVDSSSVNGAERVYWMFGVRKGIRQ